MRPASSAESGSAGLSGMLDGLGYTAIRALSSRSRCTFTSTLFLPRFAVDSARDIVYAVALHPTHHTTHTTCTHHTHTHNAAHSTVTAGVSKPNAMRRAMRCVSQSRTEHSRIEAWGDGAGVGASGRADVQVCVERVWACIRATNGSCIHTSRRSAALHRRQQQAAALAACRCAHACTDVKVRTRRCNACFIALLQVAAHMPHAAN